MFTLQQLKAAHARVKSGADFPRYIQEIKALGLLTYEFMVTDGAVAYYGSNGHQVSAPAFYGPLSISNASSAEKLKHTITIHQQGQTDFMTFCQQAADAGVEKWVIDTQTMLCTYYDLQGNALVAEPIPRAGYEQ